MTSFDSFPRALLTIFQIVTLEGWATVMYMATDAKGAAAAVLYFPLLVVCCGFFVLNLLLAVLEVNFSDARERIASERGDGPASPWTAVEAALAARESAAAAATAPSEAEMAAAAERDDTTRGKALWRRLLSLIHI